MRNALCFTLAALFSLAPVGPAAAAVSKASSSAVPFQDWSKADPSSMGAYADSQGSKLAFAGDKGPQKKGNALKLDYDLKSGGFCGLWTNQSADLSKAGTLVFPVKATEPGLVQIALKDKWNVQYVSKFQAPSKDWTVVKVDLSAFTKDSYTPEGAQVGHPMDLSQLNGLNFAPTAPGVGTLWVGPVSYEEGALQAASAAPAAPTTPEAEASPVAQTALGSKVTIQDFNSPLEGNMAGAYQDSQGSSFAFTAKSAPKGRKGDSCLEVTYNLAAGGYCGMWCRAGDSWDGVNMQGARTLTFSILSKTPVQVGLALKDKNNNQYVADAPASAAGTGWQTITVPVSAFALDPYYTPPDAVKVAAMDLSQVKTFNIAPKTPGKNVFLIDNLAGE